MTQELLDEAYKRGSDYLMKHACAPGTFLAVMDTLGYEGDPDLDKYWLAAIGLVGGTGNMSTGTCGAMAGAAMAIGLSFELEKSDAMDMMKTMSVLNAVAEVGKKVQEKYGDITCQEIQFNLTGVSYRFSHPEGMKKYMEESIKGPACLELNGDIARWTVEKILERNPGFSKR